MKRNTSKVILNKFMMRKNLVNVNIVTKDLMKKNTTKVILNQFMRGRNLMNLKDLKKNKTSTVILNQFMMKKKPYECEHCHKACDEEEHYKSHIDSVHKGKKPYVCEHCHKGFD